MNRYQQDLMTRDNRVDDKELTEQRIVGRGLADQLAGRARKLPPNDQTIPALSSRALAINAVLTITDPSRQPDSVSPAPALPPERAAAHRAALDGWLPLFDEAIQRTTDPARLRSIRHRRGFVVWAIAQLNQVQVQA